MKKILFSTYDDIRNPHYSGGGARQIHEVAKRLIKDYDVEILTWNHSGNKKETIDGVLYRRIGFPFVPPKLGNLVFQIMLPYYVATQKFDVWMESFGPPFTTSFLQLFTRKPVVGIVHMLSSEDMKRKYKISLSWIEKMGLTVYKNIVATSVSLKQEILERSPKTNITVIGNGIEKTYKYNKRKHNTFLYVGRIEINQKGLDLLLEAFRKFKEDDTNDYSLTIVGYGIEDEEIQLKTMIDNHPYKDSINFLGRLEGKEKNEIYSAARCMVVPSRFETYSVVSLEALSHGLPVISFDLRGLQWIPSTCSLKVKPFNTNSFAAALSRIVLDRELTKSASVKGIEYARKHTYGFIARKYRRLITSLLN